MEEHLKKYRFIDIDIDIYQCLMKSFAERVYPCLTPVLRQLVAEQIADCQKRIDSLQTLKREIEQTVKSVPMPYRDALYCRYIEGLTFSEIARKLHYSESTIRRHIGRGIGIIKDRKSNDGK